MKWAVAFAAVLIAASIAFASYNNAASNERMQAAKIQAQQDAAAAAMWRK